jgi:hypothetical protein
MANPLQLIIVALTAFIGILQLVLLRRRGGVENAPLVAAFTSLDKTLERMERSFRE